jgi:uncharacterized protein
LPITLDDRRRFAVARSLFKPTTLKRALHQMGFAQADPIPAPARAQDLTLRHRVKDYRAGDLERKYTKLGIEEDFFVVYSQRKLLCRYRTTDLQRPMLPPKAPGNSCSACSPC